MPHAIRPLLGLLLLCSVAGVRAQVDVSPSQTQFGDQQVNSESGPATITVSNPGNQPLTVTHVPSIEQAFRHVVGGSCGDSPFILPAQSECTVLYTFWPTVEGGYSHASELRVEGSPTVPIQMSGNGVRGQLAVTPSSILFFPTPVGTTSNAMSTVLSNVGTGVLQVTSITPASPPFARVGGSCGDLPITLHPTNSCTLEYNFTPLVVGDPRQDLTINTSLNASPWNLNLGGEGLQGNQTITFPAQADRTYSAGGSFAIDPPATTNSGLAVSYGSITSSVCTTTTAGTVTVVAAGTCTLTADQPGNASWSAAAQQTQSLTIERASQVLTFPAQSVGSRGFDAGGSFAIGPLATSAPPNPGQAIVYSSLDGGVCTVAGATVTMVAVGTCSIAANQAGDANHHAAAQATTQVQLVESSDADLWVEASRDVTRAVVGDTVAYTIRVGNHGPADAVSVQVLDLPPDSLGDVVWHCVDAIGTACPDPSTDDGAIDVSIDLPDDASVRFELLGTVLPAAVPDGDEAVMHNTANVSLPAGSSLTDPHIGNNESTVGVSVVPGAVHADGFETRPQP